MAHKTGLEDYYITKNNKKLRFGYTTGSCAAAAAKGAAEILLGGKMIREISLMTPKGILLNLELLDIQKEENAVTCAVQKDAGDDPDTTNGILVYATVEKLDGEAIEPRIVIDGGAGVGREMCIRDSNKERTASVSASISYEEQKQQFVMVKDVQGDQIDEGRLISHVDQILDTTFPEDLLGSEIKIEMGPSVYVQPETCLLYTSRSDKSY